MSLSIASFRTPTSATPRFGGWPKEYADELAKGLAKRPTPEQLSAAERKIYQSMDPGAATDWVKQFDQERTESTGANRKVVERYEYGFSCIAAHAPFTTVQALATAIQDLEKYTPSNEVVFRILNKLNRQS